MWGLEVFGMQGFGLCVQIYGPPGAVEEASVGGGAFREVCTSPKPEIINHRSETRPQLLQPLQKPGIWEP